MPRDCLPVSCPGCGASCSDCKKRQRIRATSTRRVSVCIPRKGDRAGQWSVRVSCNWSAAFRFEDGEAVDVDLIDISLTGTDCRPSTTLQASASARC